MIDEWLYDKNGDAKLYLEEDRFMSNNQKTVGTLDGEDVYTTSGEYIGSYIKGVLYDTDNRIVALTEHARGYVPTGDDIFGSPTMPDVAYAPKGLGESGHPVNPVHGGWSDETLDELFGTEL